MRYTVSMPTFLIPLVDNLGAGVASVVSVLGVAGVAAGQVPIPTGVSPELAAVLLSVGPALAWFLTKVLGAVAAYYASVKTTNRRRAEALLALSLPERGEESGKLIAAYLLKADEAENKEAALLALRGSPQVPPVHQIGPNLPKTGS